MENLQVGIIGSIIFIVLILLRVPIAYAMTVVGLGGILTIYPIDAAFKFIPTGLFSYTSNFTLASLPLFILMGTLAFYADLGRDAYSAAKAWFGRSPGGLAVATVYSSAIFGAVSGSSLSEVAVFSKIAVPEMLRANYNKRLAVGVVASAGCLDVLIPPSILLVFFGILTETSIGQLFIAGFIPGILVAVVMAISITVFCWLRPDMAPIAIDLDTSWKAKFDSLKGLWAALLLIIAVIGSIYSGWATPDEAAAVGVVGALIIIWMRGKLNFKLIKLATEDSAIVSAMIFLILGAGFIFATFLSSTGVITILANWVVDLKMPFYLLMFAIVILYLILGCFIDAISMMVLTMPVLAPIIVSMDGNLVWFGVIVTLMMAIGAVTPPLGLNCYVMKGALGDTVELRDIFMGALPFVGVMLFTVGILIVFPEITLWLPELMKASRF